MANALLAYQRKLNANPKVKAAKTKVKKLETDLKAAKRILAAARKAAAAAIRKNPCKPTVKRKKK